MLAQIGRLVRPSTTLGNLIGALVCCAIAVAAVIYSPTGIIDGLVPPIVGLGSMYFGCMAVVYQIRSAAQATHIRRS